MVKKEEQLRRIGIYWMEKELLVAVHDVNKTIDCQRYSTTVRIDKDSPELGVSDIPDFNVDDAVEKLNPKAEISKHWKIFHDFDNNPQMVYVVGDRLFSANSLVQTIFQFIRKQYENDSSIHCIIALGFTATQSQKDALKRLAQNENFVFSLSTPSPLAGLLMQQTCANTFMVQVDLNLDTCSVSVFSWKSDDSSKMLTELSKVTNEKLKGEQVRQAQRAWFQRNENTAYHPAEMTESESQKIMNSNYIVETVAEEKLEILRSLLVDVIERAAVSQTAISHVVFQNLCARVPLLNNLCCWMFPKAKLITFVDEIEMQRLCAIGLLAVDFEAFKVEQNVTN